MPEVEGRRGLSSLLAQSRARVGTRADATLVGASFLLAATAIGLTALSLPDFIRPGVWRLIFTLDIVGLAGHSIFVLRMKKVSQLGILASILLVDGMIVVNGACLGDRSGGRVIAELFALPSLYLGLYAAAWMMVPQLVAVTAGSLAIMVMGDRLNPMAVIGTFTILVSVFTPSIAAMVLRHRLVTALRRAKALSTTDPLTGLANRRAIVEQAPAVLRRALAAEGALGVVVADVDHFKRINDVHGHAIGDEVLRLVADAVRSCVRLTDVVVRLGGEEIAVLTVAAPGELADLAERIRGQVASATEPWPVTVSVGVAWAEPDRLTGDPLQVIWELVDQADDRTYVAKRAGRNRVMLPSPG